MMWVLLSLVLVGSSDAWNVLVLAWCLAIMSLMGCRGFLILFVALNCSWMVWLLLVGMFGWYYSVVLVPCCDGFIVVVPCIM